MTLPPPNTDELVSAYLDGEATPEEMAHVEAHPELLARVEAMRAVTQQLSAVPSAPAELKESHIAAALGVFDDLMVSPASSPTESEPQRRAVVASLEQARERRRPRRINALAVAAAVIAVVFIGVTAISLSTSSNSTDLADLGASAADSADSAVDDAADSTGATQSSDAPQAAPLAPEESAGAARAPGEADEGFDDALGEEAAAEEEAAMAAEPEAAFAGDADLDDAESFDTEAELADGLAQGSPAEGPVIPFELETSPFWIGAFSGQSDLALQLQQRPFVEPEIFDFETCQDSIAELEESDEPTLTALAILDNRIVEIHRIPDATSQLIVDRQSCEPVDELAP